MADVCKNMDSHYAEEQNQTLFLIHPSKKEGSPLSWASSPSFIQAILPENHEQVYRQVVPELDGKFHDGTYSPTDEGASNRRPYFDTNDAVAAGHVVFAQ